MVKKRKKLSMRGKIRKNIENQQSENSGFGYLTLPERVGLYKPKPGGRESFDILPYIVSDDNHPDKDESAELALKGDIWYRRPFKVHRNVGANQETVICLTTFGKKCPICDYRKKRTDEGANKEELKMYYTSTRNLYAVIPRDHKDYEEEFHILDMSQYTFQNQLNEEINEDEDYESFAELEGGLTLSVRWREKQLGKNKFAEASSFKFKERDDFDEDILEEVPNLDICLKTLSFKEIESKFFEIEDTDDEPEDFVKTTKKEKKTKQKVEEEPEEDSDLTWSDIEDMDEEELSEVIEAKDIDIDLDDYEDDLKGLKKAVADELDIEVPVKKKKKKEEKKPGKTSNKGKCPHGLVFGKDTDKDDVCDSCEVWDKCDEELEKNN